MALVVMTRWSRSQSFCAIALLLSPRLSSSFRIASYNFVSSRFASHSVKSQRKYISPLETADASIESEGEKVMSNYKRGQSISFTVLRFGPMGASVSIDDESAYGLVLQREITLFRDSRDGEDIEIGEVIQGFVERVRDDGKIDVSIRPLGVSRIVVVKQLVFDAIEGSPSGSIPLGDKSTPEDIASYFHGISKKDFKNAIGSLYREGLVSPGGLVTSLVADTDRQTSKVTAEATKVKKVAVDTVSVPRQTVERDSARSVFIGNLPNKITRDEVLQAVTKKLGNGIITDLRLSLDENKRPRGFGYIELKEEIMVEKAIADLNGLDIGGRTLRSDYADPTRNKKNSPTASTQSTGGARGEESASAWKQGFKKSSDIPGKVEEAPASPAKSVIPAPASGSVSVTGSGSGSGSVRTSSSTVTGKDREKVTEREKESVTSQGSGSIIGLVSPERRLLRAEVNKEKERETAINRDRSFEGESKSWVKEAERSLKFKKPTSPSSYSLDNEGARRVSKPSSTLFFGNLSLDLDDKMLKKQIEMFTGPGSVASVRFPTDKDSKKSKGYAFVDIHKVSDARRIFEEMHGYEMLGKFCNIDDETRN